MNRNAHLLVVLAAFFNLFLAGCSAKQHAYLQPGSHAVGVPDSDMPFDDYVADTRQRIEQALEELPPPQGFIGGYNIADAVDMRAPFELAPAAECGSSASANGLSEGEELKGAGKGFLLIHGLTDSPYTLRNVADDLHKAYPCALIRSILLPGHGTVPGDTLNMSYQQWQAAVRYGVNSFAQKADASSSDASSSDSSNSENSAPEELYLVGFSTGTALIIDYMNQPKPDARIRGVVLLSTAVKVRSSLAFLMPVVRHVRDWEDVQQERDAVRYESFSYNAGAELYLLTKGMVEPENAINVPMLMAVSADDFTVNAAAAREFFCYPGKSQRKLLFWYESADPELNAHQTQQPELQCDGIVSVSPASFDSRWQTLNVSHVGVSGTPADDHYGLNGRYHHCRDYELESADFERCLVEDANAVFGEDREVLEQQQQLGGRYLRRGTFNPDYDNLISRIICFADEQCEL